MVFKFYNVIRLYWSLVWQLVLSRHMSNCSPTVDRLGYHAEGENHARVSEQQIQTINKTMFNKQKSCNLFFNIRMRSQVCMHIEYTGSCIKHWCISKLKDIVNSQMDSMFTKWLATNMGLYTVHMILYVILIIT